MRTIYIGDLHIDEKSIPELTDIFREIFSYGADRAVQLGDWYDSNKPSPLELNFGTDIAKQMIRHYGGGTVLDGNGRHSILHGESVTCYLQHLGIKTVGIEHETIIDNKRILLGHFMLNESKLEYGSGKYGIKDLKDYDYVLLGHQHCTSTDTEILTEYGWMFHHQIYKGLKVATYNINTKKVEYQPILHKYLYNYNGLMYEFAKRALVTPNHRNVIQRAKDRKMSIAYSYNVKENDKLLLNTKNWDYPTVKAKFTSNWAELIGYIIGDGSYENTNTSYFSIRIRTENKMVNYLKELLLKCKLDYTLSKEKYPRFRIPYTSLKNKKFLDLIKYRVSNRLLNRFLVSLPKSKLLKLYIGLMNSDGHFYNKPNRHVDNFSQKNIVNVELFQEICLKLGKVPTTYKRQAWRTKEIQHQVNIQSTDKGYISKSLGRRCDSMNKVKYNGEVWCPEVDNGTWVAKRNGKVFITGNSPQTLVENKIFHLGSTRFQNFNEVSDPYKQIAIIDNGVLTFIPLKSPTPMVQLNTGDVDCYLEEILPTINPKTKVKVVIHSFSIFKNSLDIIKEYKNKFVEFKVELKFEKNLVTANKEVKKDNLDEIVMEEIKKISDSEVRELLEAQFKEV